MTDGCRLVNAASTVGSRVFAADPLKPMASLAFPAARVGFDCVPGLAEDLAALAQQRLAGVGEPDAATIAFEQRNLQPSYLLTQRRLGDLQPVGGLTE